MNYVYENYWYIKVAVMKIYAIRDINYLQNCLNSDFMPMDYHVRIY